MGAWVGVVCLGILIVLTIVRTIFETWPLFKKVTSKEE